MIQNSKPDSLIDAPMTQRLLTLQLRFHNRQITTICAQGTSSKMECNYHISSIFSKAKNAFKEMQLENPTKSKILTKYMTKLWGC